MDERCYTKIMKNIQNAAAFFFILAIVILSFVSVLGVWDFFSDDVIAKSFQTLGLLAIVAIIILAAGKYSGHHTETSPEVSPELPNPAFKSIRVLTVGVLIISGTLLALLGVLAIWEVVSDKDVLYKSLGSLGIISFGAFIIVMTCLDREGKFENKPHGRMSTGSIVGLVILAYLVFSMFG